MKIVQFVDRLPTYGESFDAMIVSLSSESRATNIVKKYNCVAPVRLSVFDKEKKEDYIFETNKAYLVQYGFDPIRTDNFSDLIAFYSKKTSHGVFSILIDVSCLSRPAMAEIVFGLLSIDNIDKFRILFCYSLAQFTPPTNATAPNEAIEPVHNACSGWPSRQADPTSLISGLGYEPNKAEGASEYLDPSEHWGFIPESPVKEFLQELEKNNYSLIRRLCESNRTVRYDLSKPSRTFGQLEIIISDLLTRSNPILLPFGPKLFFILCLLQSIRHPEVGVWHVTGESNEEPVDRCASDIEIGFEVTLHRRASAADI